jgi:eukaryotic-like serine/threonine-protein kinase
VLKGIEASFLELMKEEDGTLEVRKALIKTKHRLSDLARENESLQESDRVLVDALREIEIVSARWPRHESLRWLLPLNHSKRGKVALAQGRLREARTHFMEAISLLKELVADDPSVDSTRTLAISYAEQADLELAVGQVHEACRLYDLALAFLEHNDDITHSKAKRNGDEDPDYDRSILVQTLSQRANAARQAGDLRAAEGYLERALKLEVPVVQSSAGNAMYRAILASVHVELGALRMQQGQLAAALQSVRSARELGQELNRGDPTNKTYALILCQALQADERLARARGDGVQAEHALRQRCAITTEMVTLDASDLRFQRLACH